MTIGQLVTGFTFIALRHPVVGDVNWCYSDNAGCYCLVWDHGPEAGKPLIADDSVVIDSNWEERLIGTILPA